jgi:hypothetical protein
MRNAPATNVSFERDRLLTALAERVSALERRVAQLEARGRPQPDALADAQLLGALAAVFGQRVFSSLDVQAAAMHDAELGAALGGLTSSRLIGGRFRRTARTADGPYQLRRVGRDGAGVLWALYVDPSTYTPLP